MVSDCIVLSPEDVTVCFSSTIRNKIAIVHDDIMNISGIVYTIQFITMFIARNAE